PTGRLSRRSGMAPPGIRLRLAFRGTDRSRSYTITASRHWEQQQLHWPIKQPSYLGAGCSGKPTTGDLCQGRDLRLAQLWALPDVLNTGGDNGRPILGMTKLQVHA